MKSSFIYRLILLCSASLLFAESDDYEEFPKSDPQKLSKDGREGVLHEHSEETSDQLLESLNIDDVEEAEEATEVVEESEKATEVVEDPEKMEPKDDSTSVSKKVIIKERYVEKEVDAVPLKPVRTVSEYSFEGDDSVEHRFGIPILVFAEVRAHHFNIGWATASTSAASHLSKYTTSLTNSMDFKYREDMENKNYLFEGRLIARTVLLDEYIAMACLGSEVMFGDAKGYRPIDIGASVGIDVSASTWNTQDALTTQWESGYVWLPTVFVGYDNMMVGLQYDMREYNIKGNTAGLGLNRSVKDYQWLYGVRFEKEYKDFMGFNIAGSFEFMTNMAASGSNEILTYFKDLMSHSVDGVLTLDNGNAVADGELGATNYITTDSRQTVVSVNTNIMKASLGFSMQIKEY